MPNPWTDDELLAELQAALAETDQVPAHARSIGADLFTWRTVDAELADLAAVTGTDHDNDLTLSRSTRTTTVHSFTAHASWLDIDIDIEDNPPALRGRLVPRSQPMPTQITIEGPTRPTSAVPVDDVGYFEITALDRSTGPFRLRCIDVITPWLN